ncbi:hypothetical protein PHYSODRAFT_313343 [Phytophthora sojae]|uniref:Elicitin n=2 Tax=Phytophthora sojae TaxID=67593 RepID=G4Z4M9_PHYSP|nr:hypothetical protein PHYSODRAFT_313343 [Phytophthora sojae]ABB56020.1 elicitin-like protein SOL1C [Phytophthora sojae]EGZ20873.1 hypothetical protein PHYSODRAFT_313343 [Phytophthora sojae]|eukprot:XP_009523590.1 hypothetical protein PHYSODRAFT_313343 [Phytophthora sojae]
MWFVARAVAAAAVIRVTSAATCEVASLQTVLASSDTSACASDSGYVVTSLSTPTDAEMAIMCTSTACQSVVAQLEAVFPSECSIGSFALYADLTTPVTSYCSWGDLSSSESSSSGSNSGLGTGPVLLGRSLESLRGPWGSC